MKRVNLLAILAISISLTSFVACTSEEFTGTDASIAVTVEDEAQASNVSEQVVAVADEYINAFDASGYVKVSEPQKVQGVYGLGVDSGRVIITVDKTGISIFPKKISLDFGTGCIDKRGNVIKGKIYVIVSNRMNVAGSYRKMEFSNFFINDNQLKGTKTVTYKGELEGKPSWGISVKDTVIRVDGKKVIWNSERIRTRISNSDTPLIYWDDTYSITGSSNGVNANGVEFTMEITKPLITIKNWRFFVEGSVITKTEKRTALLDYGNGEKDAKATVTINGVTKEITLKK